MTQMLNFWRDEDGQDLVEYSLLMAFIALTVVALLTQVGRDISNLWVAISSKISSAAVQAAS